MGRLVGGVGKMGAAGRSLAADREQELREKLVDQLGPRIMGWLTDPCVVEIMLNPDGQLWVERLGEPQRQEGTMQPREAIAVMGSMAAHHGKVLTATDPRLSCEVPFDGSRFQGWIPPLVEAPTFVIRRRASAVFTLEDYERRGILAPEHRACIVEAVAKRQNIVVVGGTGSGKTTLANAILLQMAETCPDDRFFILEDTVELQCPARNTVALRAIATPELKVTIKDLLYDTLRGRPDRIIVGECRAGEALDLLKAWNTGHPGGVATFHASSALGGLRRLEQLISEVSVTPQQAVIAEAVNLVIFIRRTAEGGRRVDELVSVERWNGHDYVVRVVGEAPGQRAVRAVAG